MEEHHTRIREEFSRQADAMAASAVFTDAESLDRLLKATGVTSALRVLDLACGPGIVSDALAHHAAEVVAFDLTPTMLHRATQRCAAAGHTNVRYTLGQAEALPFPDSSFDVAVARSALHHFPAPDRVITEMARVVRPGGRMVLSDVVSAEDPEASTLHNALETLRDPSHVRMLPQSVLCAMLDAAQLEVTATVRWTNTRGFDEWLRITNAPERIEPLRTVMRTFAQAGIEAGVRLRLDGDHVVFDHTSLLITAHKPSL